MMVYIVEYSPTLLFVEGQRNVIVDKFSRLLHQDDTSALVGKKAITEDSELASYSLFDDKEIFDCLVNLPCLTHKNQKTIIRPVIMTLIQVSIVGVSITVFTVSLLINVT